MTVGINLTIEEWPDTAYMVSHYWYLDELEFSSNKSTSPAKIKCTGSLVSKLTRETTKVKTEKLP